MKIMNKVCTKCGKSFETEWSNRKYCYDCAPKTYGLYHKEYYERHKEERKQKSMEYLKANPDKRRLYDSRRKKNKIKNST